MSSRNQPKSPTMVFFKVTDGIQTRRFQATPGKFTHDELKQKLVSLFPDTVKENSDLILQHQDKKGVLVTLSSDQEFQEVLSNMSNNQVLKFHLANPLKSRRSKNKVTSYATSSLLHYLLQPSWSFNSDSLADQLEKDAEVLVNLLHCVHGPTSSPDIASHKQEATGEENLGSTSADVKTACNHKEKSNNEGQVSDNEEVKSKPNHSTARAATDVHNVYSHIKNGAWRPFLLGDGPFFDAGVRVTSPGVYNVGAGVLDSLASYNISWSLQCTPHYHHKCSCRECRVPAAVTA